MAQVNSRVSALSKKGKNPQPDDANQVIIDNVPQTFVAIEDLTVWHDVGAFARLLPKWNWHPCVDNFLWKTQINVDLSPTKFANMSAGDWKTGLEYLKSLSWDPDPCGKTSYIELAYDAWQKGVRFHGSCANPKSYATVVRKICNQSVKVSDVKFFPGVQKAGRSSKGKTLPAGFIGATALLSVDSLKSLAIVVLRGRSRKLKEWEKPF